MFRRLGVGAGPDGCRVHLSAVRRNRQAKDIFCWIKNFPAYRDALGRFSLNVQEGKQFRRTPNIILLLGIEGPKPRFPGVQALCLAAGQGGLGKQVRSLEILALETRDGERLWIPREL